MPVGIGLGSAAILALTLVVSVIGLYSPRLIEATVLRPYWVVRKGQYHRLLTSGFVHADIGHLFFNLLTFYFFAFPLERLIGTTRFVELYLAGLLCSDLGTWFRRRNDPHYASLGASGAILAVMFAAIVYFPRQSLYILPIPVPIPAPLFAVGYLAYSVYFSRRSGGRINHDAHIGGALTGLAFVALTTPRAFIYFLHAL